MLPGRATPEGTARFRDAAAAAPGHFRQPPGSDLWLSSLGIGTYLGRDDAATDALYASSVRRALQLGINVVDSAINYRNQRSERAVGAAVRESGQPRDGIVLCTKGGYLAFDGARPHDARRYVEDNFLRPGILEADDIVAGCHSMAPRYLSDQIDRSRRNLGVECIDVYYVHNPETQLGEVPRPEFLRRLRLAFEALERACDEGRIGCYGTATWNGYRLETDDEEYLSLPEVLGAAREVGGEKHRCRALQLPFNLEMDEAATFKNQGDRTLLGAALAADLTVFASASVLQGRLALQLSDALRAALHGLRTDAQRALQFTRSTPGIACALVGMKTPAHVDENAALAKVSPLSMQGS
ncbi:MAG TPA: aldo/keto reductase [Myxococcales bacterium]|nr:aldo/keto reductase [Myxococcales bacterium]